MPEIYYHTNNIPPALCTSEKIEKKAFFNNHQNRESIDNIVNIKNTSQLYSRFLADNRPRLFIKKINFSPIANVNEINVASYLCCRLTDCFQKDDVGIALDKKGNLLIIKGKSHNLLKGLGKKYTSGYLYHSACLTADDNDIKFRHLYINPKGKLIGEEKLTHKNYCISIDEISSSLEVQEPCVRLCLSQYEKPKSDEALTLQKKDMTRLSFHYHKEQLFLDQLQTPTQKIDYSVMEYSIRLPLKKHYRIQSIKRVSNHLQIETRKGVKSRIVYLNPEHISLKRLMASKVSHKPPQQFASRLGNDPHEKYHAGSPFTSDRKANFSSYNIPLVSSVVDTFRVHLKSAKEYRAQGKSKKAFIAMTKSVDPGIHTLYKIAAKQIDNIRQQSGSKGTQDKLMMFSRLQSQAVSLTPALNHALGNTLPLALSESMIAVVQQLKIRESVSLQNSTLVSGFFGVAVGGMPFNPGCFAGIVAILSSSYNLTLARVDNSHIHISFSERRKKEAVGILGSGQGLEQSLCTAQAINYMAVMPAEANLILVAHCTQGRDFSFTLSAVHFEQFARQLHHPEESGLFNQQQVNQATFKKTKEKELRFMLEAKSEFRVQIASLVNPVTYMVMPRSALGTRLALNLLEVKSASEITTDNHGQTLPQHTALTVDFLRPEADLFHEEKIMPVVMYQGTELWCYPLPLIEEYRPTKTFSGKKMFTLNVPTRGPTESGEIKVKPLGTVQPSVERTFRLTEIDRIPLTTEVSPALSEEKYLIKNMMLNNKPLRLLVEKLHRIKQTLRQQERDSLHKKCQTGLYCYYSLHESDDGGKKHQLKRIEIRRMSTLSHLTATAPLAIFSLANNKSVSYDELLGEVRFIYKYQTDKEPSEINFNLHIIH